MLLPAWLSHLKRNVFQKDHVEQDLDQELLAYVDLLTDEKVRAGMSPKAARRGALIETGGVELVKEQVRDVRAFEWLNGLWQDVRYSGSGSVWISGDDFPLDNLGQICPAKATVFGVPFLFQATSAFRTVPGESLGPAPPKADTNDNQQNHDELGNTHSGHAQIMTWPHLGVNLACR